MYRRAARGEAVLISEGFARLNGVQLGKCWRFGSQGLLRMPVAGIVRDFSDQQGSILISRDGIQTRLNDDTVNIFRVYLQPGADEALVRQRILDAHGRTQRLFVLTNRDVRSFITSITNQMVRTHLCADRHRRSRAILGIVNASHRFDYGPAPRTRRPPGRRRTPRQIHTHLDGGRHIGLISVVLGLALGAVTLFYAVGIARRDLIALTSVMNTASHGLAPDSVDPRRGWCAAIGPAAANRSRIPGGGARI